MVVRVLRAARRDDGGGRDGPPARQRRDLPRRDRLPGRPRSRLAVGRCCCRSASSSTCTSTCGRSACCRGIDGPLRDRAPEDIDFICIRENTEGEYCGIGGRLRKGTPDEVVTQTAIFTRKGTERVVRYAFDLAMKRKRALVSAHEVERAEPLDGLLGRGRGGGRQGLPRGHRPEPARRRAGGAHSCSILSSSTSSSPATCSATSSRTSVARSRARSACRPSGNIDPTGKHPSLFEPVHGSAPGRAGKELANPMAAIWAASMMLEQLGESEAAALVMRGVEHVAADGPRDEGPRRDREDGRHRRRGRGLHPLDAGLTPRRAALSGRRARRS